MKIIVTGGAGFIGSHLVEELLHLGHSVIVADDFNAFYDPQIKRHNLSGIINDIEVIEGDITEEKTISKLRNIDGVDVIIHLAAKAGVRPSIKDPHGYIKTNVNGTLNMLELAKELEVKKFILASSSSVYGENKKVPFNESDALNNVISPYAVSKVAAENLAGTWSYLHKMPVIALRFFTVYGPRQRPDLAIHTFTNRILNNEPIQMFGNGNTSRDYTYIDDIVHGITQALSYEESLFEIFNLGEHKTVRLKELINLLEHAIGKKARIVELPEQPGDVPHTYADINKAKTYLGYQPKIDIVEGIYRFVEWKKNQL